MRFATVLLVSTTLRRSLRRAVPLIALVWPLTAAADPYRLRADAVGITNAPQSPVGLIILQGEDRAHPMIETEALVWAGTGKEQSADALVMLVKLHDPKRRVELRLGRQMIATGAIRPIHMDGIDARSTLPTGTSFEAFGGVPVVPGLGWKEYDWLAGGRAGQTLARDTTIGVSYLQRRVGGQISGEEAGMDFASAPTKWFDLASRASYDLISPGLTEGSVSLAARGESVRPELYVTHRSPSRFLPATSLFSALGDVPSNIAGATLKWMPAPRLDVFPMIAARWVGSDPGVDGSIRTTLRLDDQGAGALTLEVRRQGADEQFTGVRAAARVPLHRLLVASTELELVLPDDPRGRGDAWPWGLVALGWTPASNWELAGAVEASSTPRATSEMNALVRLSRSWGAP